jgi:hypothetical protein
MPPLHPGDTFPELTLTVPGGQTVTAPEAFAGQFGVPLFYRGSWCPTAMPSCAPSRGAIGRLVPDDVAGLVRYVREHTPASA